MQESVQAEQELAKYRFLQAGLVVEAGLRKKREKKAVPAKFLDYLPLVSPVAWSYEAPHLRLIAEHLDKMRAGEFDRLAISMPPRHGKTETMTVRAPVFLLEHDAQEQILITGYNQSVARRFSRKARQLAQSRLAVSGDKFSTDEWETKEGGGIVARGVGTPPTGIGFGWVFIDDPIKMREEAESALYRDKVWDWFTDDLYTRLEPGGKIVLTCTRWHYDDLTARAIESEPERWHTLKLPALAEENDPLGRGVGEALWPERFPVETLERIRGVQTKEGIGEYAFESLYQQNPTPREGAFFKVSQLEIVDTLPAACRSARGWDFGASLKGDYTVGAKVARDAENVFYVTDIVRGQWLPDERNRILKQTAILDGIAVPIHIPQDPGQAGVDQKFALTRLLAGFSIRSERPTGDKVTRADTFAAQVNGGNVKMLKAEWNRAFLEELRMFPMGKHDDQVDAAVDAFGELVNRNNEIRIAIFRG